MFIVLYIYLLHCTFFLYFNCFACIYKGIIFSISHFSKHSFLVTCVCVCMYIYIYVCVCAWVCVRACVYAHEKEKLFYCAVWYQGFYYFQGTPKEGKMILSTPVGCESSITEHKQAVRHRVVRSGFSELDHLVTILNVFSQILWLITVTLILYIDQIIFIPLSHKRHFFNVHFSILSLSYSQVLQLLRFLTQHSVEHISSTQAHTYQFTFCTNVN